MGVTLSTEPGVVINPDNWVHSGSHSALPPLTVVGGHDSDGSTIYVGRAFHDGENLPAKVIPSKGHAYVAFGGCEHQKHHYEVLVGHGYAWMPCFGGNVPPNAVRTGTTTSGEPLFIGRGHHANSLTVGKIHRSHGCLYIPFGGQEIRLNNYEVLIKNAAYAPPPAYCPPKPCYPVPPCAPSYPPCPVTHQWVTANASYTPPYAVHAGHDIDQCPIYVCRAYHSGDLIPGKAMQSRGSAYVPYAGQEVRKTNYELLVGQNYHWVPASGGHVAAGAVEAGRTSSGEPLYVGRAYYNGSLTPGKIQTSHHCLYIPFGGQEVRVDSYEVLVRTF